MSLSKYFKNNLIRRVYQLDQRRQRYSHLEILSELDKSQYYSSERIRELQDNRLRNQLLNAFDNSPFFIERFSEIGIERGDIEKSDPREILRRLPTMTRKDVIGGPERIVVNNVEKSRLIEKFSGGTSGSYLRFYGDARRAATFRAATLRHDFWAGFRIGDSLAVFWGAPQDFQPKKPLRTAVREKLLGRILMISSNYLNDEAVENLTRDWQKFKPDILLAYAGALNFLVEYLEDKKISLRPPKSIITSAEVLTAPYRKKIEGYFGTKIFNRYGSREFGVIASECECHCGMHLNSENLIVECEKVDQIDGDKYLGKILITDLVNRVFPFIRYEIGDMAVCSPQSYNCECGRHLPFINEIGGRVTDYLKLPGGSYFSSTGLCATVFPFVKGLEQAQIIQEELDRLTIRIAKNGDFDEDSMKYLKSELGKYISSDVKIEYEFTEQIERSKSGKYVLAVSRLNHQDQDLPLGEVRDLL